MPTNIEHGFPPDASWRTVPSLTIVWHVVMLALVVMSLAALFMTSRSKSASDYRWTWGAVFLFVPFIAAYVLNTTDPIIRDDVRPFVFGYVLFTWLVSLIGIWREDVRLKSRGETPLSSIAVLCVVSLGLVVYALLPRVPMAREAARRSQCRNNLKQLGLAMHKFKEQHDALPDPSRGDPPVSWRIQLLPFTEQPKLFESYDQSLPWDHDKNNHVAEQQTWSYHCPSRHEPYFDFKRRYFTDYVRITGPGTAGESGRTMRSQDFTDGASQTCVVVEASGMNIVWTEPRDVDVARQPIGINLKGQGKRDSPGWMSSYHAAGGHFLLGDGSTRFLNENIDPRILNALTTRDAGDRIGDGF